MNAIKIDGIFLKDDVFEKEFQNRCQKSVEIENQRKLTEGEKLKRLNQLLDPQDELLPQGKNLKKYEKDYYDFMAGKQSK